MDGALALKLQLQNCLPADLTSTSLASTPTMSTVDGSTTYRRHRTNMRWPISRFGPPTNVASSPHQTISVRTVCTLDQAHVTLRDYHYNEELKAEGPSILSVNTKDFRLIGTEASQPNQ